MYSSPKALFFVTNRPWDLFIIYHTHRSVCAPIRFKLIVRKLLQESIEGIHFSNVLIATVLSCTDPCV